MVKPEVFKQWLENKKPMIIVDIQPADEFAKHHFEGSIETNAFPAKTDKEKARLDNLKRYLSRHLSNNEKMVLL